MNFGVIFALIKRYSFLYTRNPIRGLELVFWPAMELLLWGFLSMYIQKQTSGDFSTFIRFLIGATIFWDVLFRSQMGVSISFLEDMWTRNLLNIFVAPVRIREYLAAMFCMGVLRVSIVVLVMSLMAWALYAFNLYAFSWNLIPFFIMLMVFGFSLGILSVALILRWGQAAESLAWAVPFMIQPFSAVFYSVDTLPSFMQTVAWCFPSTYIFEGMREFIRTGVMDWSAILISAALNVVYLALAAAIFIWMFAKARKLGLLTKIATQ
ncbi:MAG: ABC transporter permease [Opitutales bacterium]|nr:ABC transporter permease [Opitutales bacterium]